VILLPAAIATATTAGLVEYVSNPGPHGFSQILYAYTEASRTTDRPSAG
jgi:K+-transporting ATPase A subunit